MRLRLEPVDHLVERFDLVVEPGREVTQRLRELRVWKTRSAQIICIQVVPLLDRVLMTMSPCRKGKSSQRPLSSSFDS